MTLDVDNQNDNQNDFVANGRDGLILPPWEELHRYGFLNALYQTTKEAMLYPGRFFGRMPSRVGLWQPLLYAVVVGVIGAFFEWMWSLTGSSLQMFMASDVSELLERPIALGLAFVCSPILICLHVFVGSGIVHLCLLLVGGSRLGFEATFRVVAYSLATATLLIIPICGNLVFSLWGLVVVVIGLQKIHDIEAWRAVLAVLLPLLFCLFSCLGIGLMLFSLGQWF